MERAAATRRVGLVEFARMIDMPLEALMLAIERHRCVGVVAGDKVLTIDLDAWNRHYETKRRRR